MKIDNDGNTCTLLDWLLYIKRVSYKNYNFSLDKVLFVAKKLDLLYPSSFIFTVAGTNGKSSVCFFLENCLVNSGYKVGLYTSPHLMDYCERIRINGKPCNDAIMHINAFYKIESMRYGISLTYFEFITLSALLIFKKFDLDVIVLEVGMGGRLDATNIINPNISIITNISFDHTEILGNTKDKIGFEKSGIFRKNIHVIIGDNDIPYAIYKAANYYKTYLHRFQYEWDWKLCDNNWYFYDNQGIIYNLPFPKISISSVASSIAALRVSPFKIHNNIIIKSLKEVFIPGRFHTIFYKPMIVVDVAHNPSSAHFFYNNLKCLLLHNLNKKKIYAVVGMLYNKDIKNTFSIFVDIVNSWFISPLKTSKSAEIGALKSCLPNSAVACCSISHALKLAIKKCHTNDLIIVFGSFYAVSEAILYIHNKYNIDII